MLSSRSPHLILSSIISSPLIAPLVTNQFARCSRLLTSAAARRHCSSSSAVAAVAAVADDPQEEMATRVLNVAEKNDAAKNIANILSHGSKSSRPGKCKFNMIYEFKYNTPSMGNADMVMTSVSGHLMNFEFPQEYSNWYQTDPKDLFSAPVRKACQTGTGKFGNTANQIRQTLELEGRRARTLIIWTDCDREGENIGFEIIGVIRKVNPNIRVRRAKFSEITPAAINRAMNSLTDPDERVSNAVDTRQILDLKIGAAFTRFQTCHLRNRFPSLNADKSLLSYGPCQFPTLGFVVERYKQIKKFVSEPFWYLEVTHQLGGITSKFNWERVRSFQMDVATAIYVKVMQEPILARVLSVDSKKKNRWRPQPMDTVAMEKLASSRLKMSAKQAMNVAEKLYTSGWISYPRTETTIFPKELPLAKLIEAQTASPHWGAFAQRILNEGGPNPRQGHKSDQAHPPIHPTKFATSLDGDQARLYDLIVRHFLACCQKDAVGSETTVKLDLNEEHFSARGLVILERNFLEVYPFEKWSAKEIGDYQLGHVFVPTSLMCHEGKTFPPALLTESDLISLMDKHGIGTDATHAEHIETIQVRGYVNKFAGRFRPTFLGLALYEGYEEIKPELTKPNLRAELERDLVSICEGRSPYEQVLARQAAAYLSVFEMTYQNRNKLEDSLRRNNSLAPQGNLKTICPLPEHVFMAGGDDDDDDDDNVQDV